MMGVRRLVILTAVLVGLGVVPATAAPGKKMPTANVVKAVWATGALFARSPGGQPDTSSRHSCTASVIKSATHDLILTAAHCLRRGRSYDFAPGFHDGHTPYGVWTVQAIYLPIGWRQHGWDRADFAVLRVAPLRGKSIQRVVGARPIGTTDYRIETRVVGYPSGTDGRPISCFNHLYRTNGFPSFDCRGYVGGVSGGPFIQNGVVVGVVGGLHTGGCVAATTYSSPFGVRLNSLVKRAVAGGKGDVVPTSTPGSGC